MAIKKNAAAVTLGRLGGKAGTGASKRRVVTPERARAAANVRWQKYYAARLANQGEKES